jgi:hypothetical protein
MSTVHNVVQYAHRDVQPSIQYCFGVALPFSSAWSYYHDMTLVFLRFAQHVPDLALARFFQRLCKTDLPT